MRAVCLGCLLLLASQPLWAGDVYRSVDANGNVRYSDRPDDEGAERVHIAVQEPPPPPPAPPAANPPAKDTTAASEPPAEPTRVKRDPTPEEQAADRAKNCKIATERQQSYQVAHRLYRTLPNGEREYLSDDEIDEARAHADDEVKKWCN